MAKKNPALSGGTGLSSASHVEASSTGDVAGVEVAAGGTPFQTGLIAVISDLLTRVVRLETHFGYVRKDVDEFKESQHEMQRTLTEMRDGIRDLPTKNDLWTWRVQWIVIGVAAIAIIVGGIIGGLAYLKPESPQPIIVQVPQSQPQTQSQPQQPTPLKPR